MIDPRAPLSMPPTTGDRVTLGPDAFADVVKDHMGDRGAVGVLHALLGRMDAATTHEARSAWIEDLGGWLHDGGGLFGGRDDEVRTRRLRTFIAALTSVHAYRESFATLFTGVVRELRGTRLFADVGIPVEPGFWREAVDRVARRLLPTAPAPRSFADFIPRLFPTRAEARWLERSPPELWKSLWALLETTEAPLSTAWIPLAGSMSDAMRILAVRIAALGVAQDIRDRLPEIPVENLPFLRLPRLCDAVQVGPPRASLSNEAALEAIEECHLTLDKVRVHIEEFGVSVDLVYRLELMTAQLMRLEQLVVLLVPRSLEALPDDLGRFARSIVRAQFQGESVLELWRASSHLLARKIVERSGKTGEHYITRTAGEWRAMLLSAAGGGFLTAFTAAFKFLSGPLGGGELLHALLNSANYAGSFLVMGAVGFTLATKQPSMTAAALAASLDAADVNDDPLLLRRSVSEETFNEAPRTIDRLVALIAQVSRSQLAAAVGNVGMVIPTAIVFDLAYKKVLGHPLLSEATASKVVVSLSPIRSGVIPYAALTGILLWVSSLGAGWFENWITYRRLPEALANHRGLKRFLGPSGAKAFAASLERGASSVGGSVTLGVLLGIVPAIGHVLELPVDVRHVTLSTGSLVFAISSLGFAGRDLVSYLEAAVGIGIIGALNFGVSFLLALAVALRARHASRGSAATFNRRLVGALVREFFRSPRAFLMPPGPSRASTRATVRPPPPVT